MTNHLYRSIDKLLKQSLQLPFKAHTEFQRAFSHEIFDNRKSDKKLIQRTNKNDDFFFHMTLFHTEF